MVTNSDLLESRSRGTTCTWPVAKTYVVQSGILLPQGKPIDRYLPLARPELPTEFAKLADAESETIVRFASTYGLLGWERSFHPASPEWSDIERELGKKRFKRFWEAGGDPVNWIVRHARVVHLVLDLTAAMSSGSLPDAIDKLKVHSSSPDSLGIDYEYVRRGSSYGIKASRKPTTPVRDALEIIATLINDNIEGFRRVLIPAPYENSATIDTEFEFNNLMECIYWLLADAIVGRKVRACRHCGRPIIATSDRIKYCPPPMAGPSVSPCMNQAKQKRFRQEKQNRSKHGRQGSRKG